MHETTLIVPGFHGSDDDHWQSWLEARLPDSRRVAGIDWESPILARWAGEVSREISAAPGAVWLVAHSFGCLASVVAAADRPDKVAGLLLVVPAEPHRFSLFGLREQYPGGISAAAALPTAPLRSPSLLVASRNDPWLEFDRAAQLAEDWGSRLVDIGAAGHVNADSGYGPWPAVFDLLLDMRATLAGQPLGAIDPDAPANRRQALARVRRHTRASLGA